MNLTSSELPARLEVEVDGGAVASLPGEPASCQCCRIVDEVDLRTALARAYDQGAAQAVAVGEAAFERNPYGEGVA